MKQKMENTFHLEGLLYESNLESKVTGSTSKNPGTTYITGTIDIATDNECLNIVSVHYSYVTEKTSKGNTNNTYTVLKNILDKNFKSVMDSSPEEAVKLRIDTSIALNEFYSDKSGALEFISAKRNEGGFIHVANGLTDDLDKRNEFNADFLLTKVTRLEADEENEVAERAILKGAIFDFKKAILPVEFVIYNTAGIDYFESMEVSNTNPLFLKVTGKQVSQTIVRKIEEESAFGEPYVKEVKRTKKEYVVTRAAHPYLWDDESSITANEVSEALAAREIHIATLKQNYEENKARKSAPTVMAASNSGFNF